MRVVTVEMRITEPSCVLHTRIAGKQTHTHTHTHTHTNKRRVSVSVQCCHSWWWCVFVLADVAPQVVVEWDDKDSPAGVELLVYDEVGLGQLFDAHQAPSIDG